MQITILKTEWNCFQIVRSTAKQMFTHIQNNESIKIASLVNQATLQILPVSYLRPSNQKTE